jgi:hypothetical protein
MRCRHHLSGGRKLRLGRRPARSQRQKHARKATDDEPSLRCATATQTTREGHAGPSWQTLRVRSHTVLSGRPHGHNDAVVLVVTGILKQANCVGDDGDVGRIALGPRVPLSMARGSSCLDRGGKHGSRAVIAVHYGDTPTTRVPSWHLRAASADCHRHRSPLRAALNSFVSLQLRCTRHTVRACPPTGEMSYVVENSPHARHARDSATLL